MNGLDDQPECPLCMEPFDIDDMHFFPCACGYKICRFCWHRIRVNENGLCPACRKPYPEDPAKFKPLTEEEISKIKKERKNKDSQRKQKAAESRKHLANIRVMQKNLVFVVGLSPRLADPEVLKKPEYFGRFGKIHKIAINNHASYNSTQGPSLSAYVTYVRQEDAVRAISIANDVKIDGRTLKASLGTTKYCSHFLKGTQCPKADCMYLHDYGEEEASFTKEDMQQGKHTHYERRLMDEFRRSQTANSSGGLGVNNHIQPLVWNTSGADSSDSSGQGSRKETPSPTEGGAPEASTLARNGPSRRRSQSHDRPHCATRLPKDAHEHCDAPKTTRLPHPPQPVIPPLMSANVKPPLLARNSDQTAAASALTFAYCQNSGDSGGGGSRGGRREREQERSKEQRGSAEGGASQPGAAAAQGGPPGDAPARCGSAQPPSPGAAPPPDPPRAPPPPAPPADQPQAPHAHPSVSSFLQSVVPQRLLSQMQLQQQHSLFSSSGFATTSLTNATLINTRQNSVLSESAAADEKAVTGAAGGTASQGAQEAAAAGVQAARPAALADINWEHSLGVAAPDQRAAHQPPLVSATQRRYDGSADDDLGFDPWQVGLSAMMGDLELTPAGRPSEFDLYDTCDDGAFAAGRASLRNGSGLANGAMGAMQAAASFAAASRNSVSSFAQQPFTPQTYANSFAHPLSHGYSTPSLHTLLRNGTSEMTATATSGGDFSAAASLPTSAFSQSVMRQSSLQAYGSLHTDAYAAQFGRAANPAGLAPPGFDAHAQNSFADPTFASGQMSLATANQALSVNSHDHLEKMLTRRHPQRQEYLQQQLRAQQLATGGTFSDGGGASDFRQQFLMQRSALPNRPTGSSTSISVEQLFGSAAAQPALYANVDGPFFAPRRAFDDLRAPPLSSPTQINGPSSMYFASDPAASPFANEPAARYANPPGRAEPVHNLSWNYADQMLGPPGFK